ncbi:hypothetical protein [Glutamicibacter sp.]|uniref:hypothetical protein n=1 Tax=Glutamicibacter sp. TaxID=1931995 RepID=UPI002B45E03C|nr:hypothetical protein [Glutamicibacter sp.]HJX79613.1 hypothetical protein [Glutamicibacter sp.]
MWKANSLRQRVILTLLGLLLLAGGGAVAWTSWAANNSGGPVQPLLRDFLPVQMPELAMYAAAIFALISVLTVWAILSALPQKPGKRTFVYQSEAGNGVSRIDSGTISQAAQDAAEKSPEISSAEIRISGSVQNPVLFARYTLRVEALPLDGMNLIREILIPQMEQALGAQFAQKHVSIDFRPKKSGPANKATLTA